MPVTLPNHGISRSARGFSLIEVLVALVVLSLGVLGVSALIVSSLKSNDSAKMRGQAAILAQAIIDNMRANVATAAVSGSYNIAIGTAAPTPGTNCITATCTSSAQVAATDLYYWKKSLAQALPSGDGSIVTVTNTVGTGATYTTATVTVQWDESRAAGTGAAGTGAFATSGCTAVTGGSTCILSITLESLL
jgi:type IV pilus assembly protein PilV